MGKQDSAFGPFTLTDKKRGKGGFATTNKSDFPKATKTSTTDGSYEQLLGRAEPATLKAVEKESRKRSRSKTKGPTSPNKEVTDPDQRKIASHLMGISASESQRHGAGEKGFRAGIREATKVAEKGGDGPGRAKAMFGAFPQAAPKSYRKDHKLGHTTGAKALDAPTGNRVDDHRNAASRDIAGGHFSDSSDDDGSLASG